MKRHPRLLLAIGAAIIALALLPGIGASLAQAQDGADEAPSSPIAQRQGPLRGITWEKPDVKIHAERDLREMSRIGVEAVRTGPVHDESLLALTDSLGLALFVDLPIEELPARRLLDTLDHASAVLDSILILAQQHSSIRHIGLARYFDSTDSTSCGPIQTLANRARQHGPPNLQVYYVTRFLESDRCAAHVDFVLFDARGREAPIRALHRWRAVEQTTPLGIAALGVWVREDTLSGLRVPNSPEVQARYFEDTLPTLLSDTLSIPLPAVFVYRWRDIQLRKPSTAHNIRSPYVEPFGLHTRTNVRRPAFDVVEGIFTGSRDTFAFRAGKPLSDGAPWTILFGWGVVILLGAFYALSPRFRHMVPRYFTAHFFYRDAVREGRDVLFSASTVLLISLGAAFGVTLSVLLEYIREAPAVSIAVGWLPIGMQDVVVTLLAQPWVLVILAACTYAVGVISWTIILALISRRRYPIAPGQALMLVVWPRWPLLLVMLAAIVFATSNNPTPTAAALIAGSWIVLSMAAMVRAVVDFVLVARVSPSLAVPAFVLYPGIAVFALALIVLSRFGSEMRFLWHLATRG